jgi:hypothetical protein
MNKILSLFILLLLTFSSWAQGWVPDRGAHIYGYTRFETGYPHVGSYSKERPTFALEQEFVYPIRRSFSVGIGAGIALYPAAYTIPIHIIGSYRFDFLGIRLSWNHRIGMNTKIGENAFFGYRYNSDIRYHRALTRKIGGFVGIGANYLWDRWGGKSLSGALNIGISYGLIRRVKRHNKAPAPYNDVPW